MCFHLNKPFDEMRFVTFKKKYQPIIMNRSDLRKKSVYNKKNSTLFRCCFLWIGNF